MTQVDMSGQQIVRAGLLGRGIGLSRTPAMHMAEGRAQGLAFDYHLIDMDDPARADRRLEDELAGAEAAGFAGLNVTFPFKIAIIDHLHALSENARALGAVNTVVFRDGRRTGHNTDLWGFRESFRQGMEGVATGRVLLLGAGGAGLAVAHALMSFGPERLYVRDTDAARAAHLVENLAARFGRGRAVAVGAVEEVVPEIDGVVNATPMGMVKMPGCAFPKPLLRREMWVADIIYFPLETELLAAARKAGCRVLPGAGMAVFQAVRAFELFTGRPADPARMRTTFETLGP